jgi:hypothetical protein
MLGHGPVRRRLEAAGQELTDKRGRMKGRADGWAEEQLKQLALALLRVSTLDDALVVSGLTA